MGQKEMLKNAKNAIMRNMVWSFLGVFVNSLMNLLLTPYVTERIGVEAYGFVALANTFTGYLDIISVGLNAFAGRFISMAWHQGEKDRACRFYTSTILADLFLSVLILIPGGLMIWRLERFFRVPAGILGDVKLLFFLILLKYLITVTRTAFDTAAFIANRLDLTEQRQGASALIQAGILLPLCLFFSPHVWYVGLSAFLAALWLFLSVRRLGKRLVPGLSCRPGGWSPAAVKELVLAGIWTSINNLGNVLNSGLDLLITNLMLSAAVLGEISIAKNLGALCYTVVVKIGNSFRPRLLVHYAQGRTDRTASLFQTAMKITGAFCSLCICLFLSCGRDFLRLWLPGQDTEFLFGAVLLVLLSDIATGVVSPLYFTFTLTKKLRLPCAVTVAMGCANVLSMYLLIRYAAMGGYAVLLTTLAVNCVHFIDTPLYAAWCLKLPLKTFYPVIVRHLFTAAAGISFAFFLETALPAAEGWGELLFKGGLCGAVFAAAFAFLMFDKNERKAIWERKR